MARKNKTKTEAAPAPQADEARTLTLAEALEEAGQTMEDLKPEADAPKATRPAGHSNLALTISRHRKSYNVALAPNGKKTQNTGDEVAALLLHVPFPELMAFGVAFLGGASYDHLNPGHARMCIGNKVRASWRKGEQGTIAWLLSFKPKAEGDDSAAEEPTEG